MKILVWLLLTPWTVILRGWVLTKMWHWFIVQPFHQNELRIPVALGISSLVALLTMQPNQSDKKQYYVELLVLSVIRPLICLFFGWIYQLFL